MTSPPPGSSTQDTPPELLLEDSVLEVVRWPLTERVRVRLDTEKLVVQRGTVLTMLRGNNRHMDMALASITEVRFGDDNETVTLVSEGNDDIVLHGDKAIQLGSTLWAMGLPERVAKVRAEELSGSAGALVSPGVDVSGAIQVGPSGLAFTPIGLLTQIVRARPLRVDSEHLLGAWIAADDTLRVSHDDGTPRFRTADPAVLLQALRHVMSRAPEPDVGPGGELPLEATVLAVQERFAGVPLPELGEPLLAGRGVWTPDDRTAHRATIVLGTEHVLVLADSPEIEPWSMHTGRLRRGDGPDDPIDTPLLRLADRSQTYIIRPVGGSPFVHTFWEAASPHQYAVPGEDYDPEPWRGVTGKARFMRLVPEDLVEQVYRPAMVVQREDGIAVVLRENDPWPWKRGAFLRAEVSRPRGVFRFAAQFLREDVDVEPPREAVSHLGAARDEPLRSMVMMPGPVAPTLQPPKRTLLRLPTDESVRIIVVELTDVCDAPKGTRIRGRLADISASGCAIQLTAEIPVGSELMVIPSGQTQYQFRAEVMGVRTIPEASRLDRTMEFEMGLRFMGINESRLSWLQREILRRQRKLVAIRAASDDLDDDALPILDRQYHS